MRFFLKFIFLSFFLLWANSWGFAKASKSLNLGIFGRMGMGMYFVFHLKKYNTSRLKVDETVQMSKISDIHLLTCLQLSLSLSIGMKSYSKPRLQNRVSNIWGIRILLHIAYLIANTKSS